MTPAVPHSRHSTGARERSRCPPHSLHSHHMFCAPFRLSGVLARHVGMKPLVDLRLIDRASTRRKVDTGPLLSRAPKHLRVMAQRDLFTGAREGSSDDTLLGARERRPRGPTRPRGCAGRGPTRSLCRQVTDPPLPESATNRGHGTAVGRCAPRAHPQGPSFHWLPSGRPIRGAGGHDRRVPSGPPVRAPRRIGAPFRACGGSGRWRRRRPRRRRGAGRKSRSGGRRPRPCRGGP
jgi:hypothetical protein